MKKILTVVGVAVALTLSGCSIGFGGDAKTAAPGPTVTASTAANPSESAKPVEATTSTPATESPVTSGKHTPNDFSKGQIPNDTFVALVRKNTTAMTNVSDSAILLVPGKSCASLGNGEDFKSLLMGTVESIQTSIEKETGAPATYTDAMGKDVGFLIGAGVASYCPQYTETLKASSAAAAGK